MRRPALLAVLVIGASAAGTARAEDTGQPPQAPPAPPPTTTEARSDTTQVKGFGQRGSFLFSVEGVLGVLHQTVSDGGSVSIDNTGFFPGITPIVGTRLGLHGLAESGLTYGGVVALAHYSETGSGNGGITEVQLGPRIGYAGTLPKTSVIGYWGRVGPTFTYFNETAGNGSDILTYWDLSFEAFLVYTPVEHFGLLAGPSLDVALFGNENDNAGKNNSSLYGTFGINLGLVFDF